MFVADLHELTDGDAADGDARRTLFSRVMEGRGWATIVIAYEERAADGGWRGPKLSVLRMRRAGDGWKKHAQVNLPAEHVASLQALLGEHATAFARGVADPDDGE
jgi:hypothetical protein